MNSRCKYTLYGNVYIKDAEMEFSEALNLVGSDEALVLWDSEAANKFGNEISETTSVRVVKWTEDTEHYSLGIFATVYIDNLRFDWDGMKWETREYRR